MSPTLRHAFTLMELIISISILSLIMLLTIQSLDMGMKMNDRTTRQTDINDKANDILNKLALQLRLASAGSTAATSLELPGNYPLGYVPVDPSKTDKVTAYYFAMSTGLSGSPAWAETYEPFKRAIIYDASVLPGRLLIRESDSFGNPLPPISLTEDVDENGFNLTRVGNTLQMALTLRSKMRTQDDVVYTAQAQTLFLRSTLNASSGSAATTFVSAPDEGTGEIPNTTTAAPSVMFGNLVTELTTIPQQQQISIYITAPIGQKINPKTIKVIFGNSDDSINAEVPEGGTVTVGTATVSRQTYPPANQWPSRNGTYSVTLTGNIPNTVTITASASNGAGVSATTTKRYQ